MGSEMCIRDSTSLSNMSSPPREGRICKDIVVHESISSVASKSSILKPLSGGPNGSSLARALLLITAREESDFKLFQISDGLLPYNGS